MLKRIFFLAALLLFAPLPSVEARVYLDISAPTFVQIPLVLPKWKSVERTPAALSTKAYEMLANDLSLSGFFKVIDYAHLPAQLQGKEGIPTTLSLRDWMPSGGETARYRIGRVPAHGR